MKRPELSAIYRTLAQLQGSWILKEKPGDHDAWEILFSALEYLDEPGVAGVKRLGVSPDTVARAYEVLVGPETRLARELAQMIETAVKAGKSTGRWDQEANALGSLAASMLRTPPSDVRELEKRLRGHFVHKKQGPIPRGRWTTPQIAGFLTGKKSTPKLVARLQKAAKREK